jgi:hypothetical protein
MALNNRERSDAIQAAARALLEERQVDIEQPVPYRELAPILVVRIKCDISTAKRHIVKAARIMRGELVASWGGKREGAGRPKGE